MGETRYIQTFDGDGNLISEEPYTVSDEEVYQDGLAHEFNEVHVAGISAFKNWDNLTRAQKDIVLKNLLKWALWKDGRLQVGVL